MLMLEFFHFLQHSYAALSPNMKTNLKVLWPFKRKTNKTVSHVSITRSGKKYYLSQNKTEYSQYGKIGDLWDFREKLCMEVIFQNVVNIRGYKSWEQRNIYNVGWIGRGAMYLVPDWFYFCKTEQNVSWLASYQL